MSKEKLPLSAFIITYNEEDRIAQTLESLKEWVDDIIVIDSGSSDKTCTIAENYHARVFINPFQGYGPQKRFGEDQAKHRWVLNLDADEYISPPLQKEIKDLFETGQINNHQSYYLKRQEIFLNQEKPSSHALCSKWLRLYHLDYARFQNSAAHDYVIVEKGTTGTLKNVFYHKSLRSWRHAIEKLNNYSDILAKVEYERGRKPSRLKLVTSPFFYFLKVYFLKRYFLQGVPGFLQSMSYVFLRQMKYAKTLELFLKNKNEMETK